MVFPNNELLELSVSRKDEVFVSFASATGNAMSIAKRIHSLLDLSTPLEPLNKYTCPEAVNEDKETMQNVNDLPFNDLCSNYQGGLSLNGKNVHFLFLVVSTTGNGDIPENGDRFFRKLKRLSRSKNYNQLRALAFSELALGDTNYSDFCGAGKKIRSLFIDMGAREMTQFATADDATGMEEVVEKWVSDVADLKLVQNDNISNVDEEINNNNLNSISNNNLHQKLIGETSTFSLVQTNENERGFDLDYYSNYFASEFSTDKFLTTTKIKVKNTKFLTSSSSTKTVLHFELDISDAPQFKSYEPGDAIGIFPENSDLDVENLLKIIDFPIEDAKSIILKLDKFSESNAFKHIVFPNSLFTILKYYIDITEVLEVPQLSLLARYCTDENEKRLLTSWTIPTNLSQYRVQIYNLRLNIIDFLEKYTSCKPTIIQLFNILSPQKPRYYSISSSPLLFPEEIHFAFNIVKYEIQNKIKFGLCTNYLADCAQRLKEDPNTEIKLPVFMRSTPEFRLPKGKDSGCPIIMIGPGTGITPFRAFAQHRSLQKNSVASQASKNWLLHGCQKLNTDFLYHEDFLSLEKNKSLTLLVACSQESEHGWIKTYFVQDIIYEYANQIVSLMEDQHGYLYMCGDAEKVYSHIINAIKYILHEELGITIDEAEKKIQSWKNDKRFQVDAW